MTDIILPPAGRGQGVVVAHAWWGLNRTVRDYGAALAAEGFVVALPDLFDGRTATTAEAAQELADTDWSPNAAERLRQANAELLAHPAVEGTGLAAVGFSYSGWHLLGMLGSDAAFERAVVYYATRQLGPDHAPVLMHFAENDPFESSEDMNAMSRDLLAAGGANAAFTYPGTSHWFAEADRPEYDAAAAQLAFERTVAFLRRS